MRIEELSSLGGSRAVWESLEASTGRIYSTWEWADAWWEVFGDGGQLELRLVCDEGRSLALLPLYRRHRGALDLLRLIGHGAADELGVVCAPADAALAARALGVVSQGDLLLRGLTLVDRLSERDPLAQSLHGVSVRTEASPVLRAEGLDGEAWLRSRSANLRQQLRRRERALRRDHGLRYRLTSEPSALPGDFATLVRLHRARWANGDSVAFSPRRERFHLEFARRALTRGWLRLWIAEADDQPVAAWYGFRFGGIEWYYQAGRDPRWDHTAVGQVLLWHSIRTALDDGVSAYRFGIGDEPYKSRFATDEECVRTYALGRAPARGAAGAAAHLATLLPPGLRRKIVRRVA